MKKLISSMMNKGIPARSRYVVDDDFYRRKYNIDKAEDAFSHYLKEGFSNDLNPNPIINTRFIKDNFGVKTFLDLVAFIENAEGNPSQYFDVEFYYTIHTDVKLAGVPAIKHFMRNGRKEGRKFSEFHNYTYNEVVEIEIAGEKESDIYLKELQELSESDQAVELLPFVDHWDNSYALKHKYALRSNKKIDKRSEDKDFFGLDNIAIIGDLSIPQCKKYRILQKVEYFKSIGKKCQFSHWLDVPRSLNILQLASSVIFYRVPHTKLISSYIDECTRLGIRFGYDIDDPVFDLRIYSSNINLNFVSFKEKQSILSGVDSYASMVRQVEFLITSTPAMRSHLRDLTSKPIYIWRNVLDSETLNAAHIDHQIHGGALKKKKSKDFIINYASGSRAHEADFATVIESLHRVLNEFPHVILKVMGYCAMSTKLKMRFPKQVKHVEFKDYVTYIGEIADGNLNIIPLVKDDFNDCKSAIRYLEASIMGVPTIVTAIGDFVNLIDNQVNGILVENHKDWYARLVDCINGKIDLDAIAVKAKESVLETQTIEELGARLDDKLKAVL
jgi:glycosyltransferase involved in cell wall biosynthesis